MSTDTEPLRTHCYRGHVLTSTNRYIQTDGRIVCRICNRDNQRKYRERKGIAGKTPEQRFWSHIRKEDNGCWRWTGNINSVTGYGRFCVKYVEHVAHRYSYELLVGTIPEGLQLHHLCRNRWCVNPNHLLPITSRDHLRLENPLIVSNLSKTHCPVGHPYTEENTLRDKTTGKRKCRECALARLRQKSKQQEIIASLRRKSTPLSRDYCFVSPTGQSFLHIANMKQFCEEHQLSYKQMSKVHRGDRTRHQGWTKWVTTMDETRD